MTEALGYTEPYIDPPYQLEENTVFELISERSSLDWEALSMSGFTL